MPDVVVGYLHGDLVTQEFLHCLFGMFIHDTWGPRRILNFAPQFSGANICKARNQMVRDMLDQEQAEWLWILDSDATFPPNALDALLAAADPSKRPIVGALAHQLRGKTDENYEPVMGDDGRQVREVLPTMYKTEWDNDEWVGYREVTAYTLGLNEVDATGCHCLLVHREVFEKIEDTTHPYRWFRETEIAPGIVAGEDIWFCLQARKAGFPIYVDTRLEAGHVKTTLLTSEMSHVERIT